MNYEDEYGLWKESNGYAFIEPSDCWDVGGMYCTQYDADGRFLYTNVPWQVGDRSQDLTTEDMEAAKS